MTFIFDDINRPEVLRRERRLKQFFIGLIVALVLGSFLYYEFKNYPEERVVKRFLTALESGDYNRAYQIWKPAPSYTFQDFQRDWGPNSDYGKVQKFGIVTSHASGSGVIVTAEVNGKEARIWVERSNKAMAFPPF